MFRLTTRLSSSSAQAVQCVRELAMANNAGLNATIGSANITRMRGVTGILAQSASYSSVPRQMTQQMTLKEVGIMDPYVIPEKENRPSIFSDYKTWIKYAKLRMRNTGMTAASTLGMCWKLKDFGITGRFLGESEEAYIGMNEAFAKGDRKYLEEICTPSMYAKLKGQLKDRVGRYEWRYHGLLEKPQIVSIRQGQIGGHVLIQMIVRLKSNQSMGVYDKKNKLIAGDLKKPVPVLEYIVFQRYITDPEDNWRILGKTAPSS
ncbi:39S ribosomal protein L45, mitochondrial [Podila minutissima]|uniref:Large ribosomal subunit protein mL45 n=1 Tax=Podila minutissima TaxID=64525 RepID=A0A9P5SUQ4_9FUNG|nr:39S ribosomal protein L45, mitochondrial [Podila minutissima]